jgi:protein-S-isoprenylcysteine O-methyltransferase Ste14
LDDVSTGTKSYAALAVRATGRRTKKEEKIVLMRRATRQENGTSANRILLAAPYAILAVLVGFLSVAAIMGPDSAIDWVINYLLPVGVITGVVIASLALLVWAVKRLPNPPYQDWYQ